jgi:predicted transcriptional regulator of viral defense system
MRPLDFVRTHPVFTHAEFVAAHLAAGNRSRRTSDSLLAGYVRSGRVVRVRRGLYASVPEGAIAADHSVDPYLLATKLAADAVVAYHAALQFHGKASTLWRRFHYLTADRARRFVHRDAEFVPVQVPVALRALEDAGGGVDTVRYAGGVVRVTSLERTLVDVLDAPDKAGGWEELWRSLELVEYFDLDAVVEHAIQRGSALTVARVGLYLELHRETLMVEDTHLDALQSHAPRQPRYLDSERVPGRLVSRWNLVVPPWLLVGSSAEVS